MGTQRKFYINAKTDISLKTEIRSPEIAFLTIERYK